MRENYNLQPGVTEDMIVGPEDYDEIDDGGPALPRDGMTLRQYYAGQALSGIVVAFEMWGQANKGNSWNPELIADQAFQLADAMILYEKK